MEDLWLWVSISWRSICAITGSTAVTVACAGSPWPERPESYNPGGIPNVAAKLPLCPPLPVCQVPGVTALQNRRTGTWWWWKTDPWVIVADGSPGPCNGSTPIPDACHGSELELSPGPNTRGGPCGPAMLYIGVVPVLRWPPSPETISASALAEPPGFTVLSGDVLGLIGAGPDIFTGSDLLRSLLKASQLTSVICGAALFHSSDLSQTRQVWQLSSLFFLEESWRVKRSDTQTFSNFRPSEQAVLWMILFLVGASVVHIGHLKLASYYFVASGGFDCLQKKAHQPFAALRWLLDVFLAVEKFVGFCAGGRPASIWMIVLNTLLPLVGPPCPSRLLPSRLLTKFSAQKEHESSFCGHSISRRPSLRQLINSLISATCNRMCWTTWRKPKGVGRKKKRKNMNHDLFSQSRY